MSKNKKVDFTLVNSLLNEADKTIEDDSRVTSDVQGDLGKLMDSILKSEIFGASVAGAGLVVGGIAGVGLLSALGAVTGLGAAGITSGLAAAGGLVGGSMVAGIGVLAAPAVILGGGAYYAANKIRQTKLIQEKEILIQRIVVAHEHLLKKLETQNAANAERIAHLKLMIDLLLGVKKDLEDSIPQKNASYEKESDHEAMLEREYTPAEISNNNQNILSDNLTKGFDKAKGAMFALASQIQKLKGIPLPDFTISADEKGKINNDFQDETDVLKYQRDRLVTASDAVDEQTKLLDEVGNKLSGLKDVAFGLTSNIKLPSNIRFPTSKKQSDDKNEEFESILQEANERGYTNIDIYNVATIEEVNEANSLLRQYYKEYTEQYDLDAVDYALSGIIGTIAALMDLLLVTTIKGDTVTPGKAKSGVEALWKKLLSNETIANLEQEFKVGYDISQNTSKITQDILGLCPNYHRFMSLGHDPILGLLFGVKDLILGELTAIDGAGRVIIQNVAGNEKKNIIEAVIYVFGHFLSDVTTQSEKGKILSVPAPLTPLLQLVQSGSIEYKGKNLTIAELSKKMYFDGYNFNHFLGMSLPVFLIEVFTRVAFFVKENLYLKKDSKMNKNPKLQTMLFLGNSLLFAENIGKVVITENPMSINYVSWISTAKYGYQTLKWVSYGREIGKMDNAQNYIDNLWDELDSKKVDDGQYIIE